MRISSLKALLYATTAASQLSRLNVLNGRFGHQLINGLQERATVDWKNPPTAEAMLGTEKDCFLAPLDIVECSSYDVGSIKKMVPETTPGSKTPPNITIYVNRQEEPGTGTITNAVEERIVSKKSTKIIDKTTKGWKVGGQLSGGLKGTPGTGPEISGGITISAEYSSLAEKAKEEVEEIARTNICPPYHECVAETWTFHAKISGYCENKPIAKCDDYYSGETTEDICTDFPRGFCKPFDAIKQRQCTDGTTKYAFEPCEFHTPILSQGGHVYSRRVWLTNNLTGDKHLERAPRELAGLNTSFTNPEPDVTSPTTVIEAEHSTSAVPELSGLNITFIDP